MKEAAVDNHIAQRILQAGVRLFAEKGYAATSTREIAEAAGITKPMLYYYFESKEGLCRAAIDLYMAQVTARLDTVFARPMDPLDRIVEVLWVYTAFMEKQPEIVRLGAAFTYGSQKVPGVEMASATEQLEMCLERAVEALRLAGGVRDGQSDTLLRLLRGLLALEDTDTLHNRALQSNREFVERLVRELMRGFEP